MTIKLVKWRARSNLSLHSPGLKVATANRSIECLNVPRSARYYSLPLCVGTMRIITDITDITDPDLIQKMLDHIAA